MSFIPNTKYYITQTNPDGSKQQVDLSYLFNGGTSSTTTNLNFLNLSGNYVDINTIFNARTTEPPIADTGYKVPVSGVPTDLNLIFQPKLTTESYFTISSIYDPPGPIYNYKTLSSGGYFYILIPANGQVSGDQIGNIITFNQNITSVNIVMVAGGGAGKYADTVNGGSGVGGGGGGVVWSSFNATAGDGYYMYIGSGSNGDGGGGYIDRTSFTKTDYNTSNVKLEVIGGYDGATWGTAGDISPLSSASLAVFTILGGGLGGNGGASVTVPGGKNLSNNGLPSALPMFTTPTSGSIYLGCGGGAGDYTVTGTGAFGGTAGSHVGGEGGICGDYTIVTGEDGFYNPYNSSISYGKFGSGGGGGAYNPDDGNNGWKSYGGNGVILIYFNPTPFNTITSSGGTSVSSGLYTVVSFLTTGNNTGSITINSSITNKFYYLLVAGGGGGGGFWGGGGGGGGVLQGDFSISGSDTINFTIGDGGAGGVGVNNGSNSVISYNSTPQYTAIGGGRGGDINAPSNAGPSTGGSGGGAGAYGNPSPPTPYTGASGTSGQGNSGGNGAWAGYSPSTGNRAAGGGGGKGTIGANSTTDNGGAGGNGVNSNQPGISSIYGSTFYYGAGGGGGGYTTGGNGGNSNLGGAGKGAQSTGLGSGSTGFPGTANTGGGGGGGAGQTTSAYGGAGGSGIIVIAYLTPV